MLDYKVFRQQAIDYQKSYIETLLGIDLDVCGRTSNVIIVYT